jgi:putative membrane protein
MGRMWLWGTVLAGTLSFTGAAYAQPGDNQASPETNSLDRPERSSQSGSDVPAGGAVDKAGGTMDSFSNQKNTARAASPTTTGGTSSGAGSVGVGSIDGSPGSSGTQAGHMTEDARIIAKLHHINQMEVDAGKLAEDKGQAKAVRDYGARLVRDHQSADKKIVAYADKNGIDANAMPPAGNDQEAKDMDKMDRLRNLTGAEFDRTFASTMLEGHQKAIDLVQSARDTVTDGQLKGMLGQLLPTLEKHRQIAQNLVSTQNVSTDEETGAKSTVQGRRPAKR